MVVEKKEKKTNAQSEQQNAAAQADDAPSELRARVWSVISFEECEASGLTYAEAEQKLAELEAQNFSGLCIVTDEVAARIAAKNKE